MAVTITVEGISCAGCEKTVEKTLTDVEGVESVTADQTSNSVTVEGNADSVALLTAVENTGYTSYVEE